jgi:L-ascorbate metabolism protein UlaG (beta-lactamase superfamily)
LPTLAISWLGHSTFIIRTPGGKRILLDPWLTTNPSCPAAELGELLRLALKRLARL